MAFIGQVVAIINTNQTQFLVITINISFNLVIL